jgi:hypothetical protein
MVVSMASCAFTRLVHSDWSTTPVKRWFAEARRTSSGWFVEAPRPVGLLDDFLNGLIGLPQPTLAGFDFPISVPAAYARKARVSKLTELLEVLGAGDWLEFYRVCDEGKEYHCIAPSTLECRLRRRDKGICATHLALTISMC